MASDSDTEEFYDAAEDVNLTPSPNVSPAKFVLPSTKVRETALHTGFTCAVRAN
uniref:Uncharacterized protein n=1 Tax=Anguilla anguilla TaxID=7936 RepID=A0A0E9WLJ1_ANGAN